MKRIRNTFFVNLGPLHCYNGHYLPHAFINTLIKPRKSLKVFQLINVFSFEGEEHPWNFGIHCTKKGFF